MTDYEGSYILLTMTQIVVSFFALIAAVYIGIRQNQISKAQLGINFSPSLMILYDHGQRKVILRNKGKTNVYLFGDKFDAQPINISERPMIIVPDSELFFPMRPLEDIVKQKQARGTDAEAEMQFFLGNEAREKYICKVIFIGRFVDGVFDRIDTQTFACDRVYFWRVK